MSRTISAASGHTLFVKQIDPASVPAKVQGNAYFDAYPRVYEVRNWDAGGVVFFYLAKGNAKAPNEVCVFYKNGQFWTGYGNNFKEAIDGAQRDGWLYTEDLA